MCSLALALPTNACAQNAPEHSQSNGSLSASESNEKNASLDEILEAGKIEWMKNATHEFGEETSVIWDETVEEFNVR